MPIITKSTVTGLDKPLIIGDFNGVVDLRNFIEEKEPTKSWKTIRDNKEARDWTNGCNYKKAKEQLIYGDSSYTSYFIDGLDSLNKEENENGSFGFDVEGSCYDMGSVIAGVPECCIRQDYVDSKKYIKIYMGIAFNWRIDSNIIKNRGVAIFNLISNLTLQGYIVDLCVGDYANTWEDKNSWMKVHIPSTSLVISTLAFLCTPQFFRIISFITADMLTGQPNVSGESNSIKPDNFQKKLEDDGYFYIPDGYDIHDDDKLNEDFKTIERATETIKNMFNDYCSRKNSKKMKNNEKN